MMTVNEAYQEADNLIGMAKIKAEDIIETAKIKAAYLIKMAKENAYKQMDIDFDEFVKRHGEIVKKDEYDYDFDNRGNWRHMKLYAAKDGKNLYEVTDYPTTDKGLRVEYWSDDKKSTIIYL